MLRTNKIKECNINVDDTKRVLYIYGPDTTVLKRKTVQKVSNRINKITVIEVPKEIRDNNKNIYLYVDYMYLQGVTMLTTISSGYNFRTVDPLINKKKANKTDILDGPKRVLQMYQSRGLYRSPQITSLNA